MGGQVIMDIMKNLLKTTIEEIERKLGNEVDLNNEMYILQTPDGYIQIGIEKNDDNEDTLKFLINSGRLTYIKTDKDIISHLFADGGQKQ